MAVGDSLRLHPAIYKWPLVVSSYEYNMSRKSVQTIIILNSKAGNSIKYSTIEAVCPLYEAILYLHRSTGHGHAARRMVWVEDGFRRARLDEC